MIGEKLSYLAQNVQISDFRPADSYYEVYELLHKRLEEVGVQLETLVSNDLNEFVKKMNTKGINTIVLK
jgi:2-hydroxy-3-keto-5-methylthiopentenyl-1-phosphate phosphatase